MQHPPIPCHCAGDERSMVQMEGNLYESADDGRKNQKKGSVFLADVLLTPSILWIGRTYGANVVDVVGVLQWNLHEIDDEHNANEGGSFDQMIQPISTPRNMSGESDEHLSKGR